VNALHALATWLERCERVLAYAGMLATFAMMCLTSADALSRYLLNSPITGAYEITEKFLMVAAIFLGLSYAYRGGVFIRVTFLTDRLPGALKAVANYIAYLATLLFCLFVLVATAGQALQALKDTTTLSTMPIPLGPAYCLVPLGFLALTLLLLVDLPRVGGGRAFLFENDSPSG
jgi:TRAP-type C4-dicarboxylate transport system permease small subunit